MMMVRTTLAVLILTATGWIDSAAAQSRSSWTPGLTFSAGTSLEVDNPPWGVGGGGELMLRKGRLSFGAELGYQSLGTHTTRVENFDNQPGWVLIEDISRSMIRVAALARYDLTRDGLRPYLVASAGAYNGRFRDRIVVFDDDGNRVPFYDFDGSGHDTKPAMSLGAGITVASLRSGPSLGLEARWHGIFSVTPGGFETVDLIAAGIVVRW